jgi:Whirly transcription factor
MVQRPLQYAVYKGMSGKFGAVQLNFQPAHYYREKEKDFTGERALDRSGRVLEAEGWRQREGAVFVEVAPPSGANKYDWEKKITFALSVTDMGKIIHFLTTGKDLAIMHDPGAKTEAQGAVKKYLNLTSPKGLLDGGCMLQLSQSSSEDKLSHTVPLSPDESIVIKQLLLTAVASALQW